MDVAPLPADPASRTPVASPPGPARQPEAFRGIFDAHAGYVMKSLKRLGVRPADVEDLTHEVFLAVLRRWEAYDRARPVRPWLFAFALRVASAYRQSAYVRRERAGESTLMRVPLAGAPAEVVATSNAVGVGQLALDATYVYWATDAGILRVAK